MLALEESAHVRQVIAPERVKGTLKLAVECFGGAEPQFPPFLKIKKEVPLGGWSVSCGRSLKTCRTSHGRGPNSTKLTAHWQAQLIAYIVKDRSRALVVNVTI